MKNINTLINYVDEIKEKNNSSASALYIIKNNEVVLEHYNGNHSNTTDAVPTSSSSQFNVASARKSYLALAVAYAIHKKKIHSLDDLANNYFLDLDPNILGRTTLRHLVTHSHGLHEQEDGTIYREFEPGTSWAYRRINVQLMTKLVNDLFNQSYTQLLKNLVFQPLGFEKTEWHNEPNEELVKEIIDPAYQGTYKIGAKKDGFESNLHTSAREFALWGNLHLNKGRYDGKQIVPEEVIDMAIQIQSSNYKHNELPQNGIFWYVQGEPKQFSEIGERVPKGSFQILGITGPTLLVIPKYNIVVAKMYNKRFNYGGDNYLHYLREFSNLVVDCI